MNIMMYTLLYDCMNLQRRVVGCGSSTIQQEDAVTSQPRHYRRHLQMQRDSKTHKIHFSN